MTDTKPKRPALGPLVTGEVVATAVAAWGPLVVFGDAEGAASPDRARTVPHRRYAVAAVLAVRRESCGRRTCGARGVIWRLRHSWLSGESRVGSGRVLRGE